jgi:tetratricopeptide (TPR) repeat protein
LAALTLATYLPALDGPFIWDDLQLIFDSPRVMEIQPLRAYWGSSFWTRGDVEPLGRNYYRPLSILSLALDHKVHGTNPGGYHLTNGLFHAANAVLLFALLRRRQLTTTLAGLLAFAWASFPRLTEAAAWISGRTDVLATFFVLIGLLCGGRRQPALRWCAAASILMGLFAKEVALAGLVGVAILEWNESRSSALASRLWRLVPIGSVAFAYVGIRAWAMGVGLRENGLPWSARGIAALEASGRYLWMTLDGWQPGIHLGHLGDPSLRFVVLGAIAWLAAGTLGWRFWRRPTGQQLAALATLAVSLTLVLHVIPITINVAAADRFLYLPLAALALCLAPWIASLAPGRATLALALLALSYAPVTFARAQIWADEVAFWSKAFREQSHHNGMSRLELGNVYGRVGLQSYALALYLDADTEDYANYLLTRHNAGTRLILLGRYEEATTILEDLVRRAPEIPKFHFSLASAYLTAHRFDDAEQELAIALRLYPDSSSALGLRQIVARLRRAPAVAESEVASLHGKLAQVSLDAQSGRHKDALELLLTATSAPEIKLSDLTEAVLYAFDWGTPRQLTTLYDRYRTHGGSAPAIIDNYELRMERVRRLRALWPTLRGSSSAPRATSSSRAQPEARLPTD